MSEDCNYYNLPNQSSVCFFGGANNTNDDCKSRPGNRECNTNDEELIGEIIDEVIKTKGTLTGYYVHTYNTLSADAIYGEQPTAAYHPPKDIVMYIELEEDAVEYSRFGWRSDDSVTAYVHISSFATAFSGDNVHSDNGQRVEPKADDVFQLVEYGKARPGQRDGKYFIVTERMDSDIANMNPLGAHYTWRVRAKRFEWSFEPGLSGEGGDDQVYDDTFFGRLSGTNEKTDTKTGSASDADTISKNDIFDMDNNNTNPYGDFG